MNLPLEHAVLVSAAPASDVSVASRRLHSSIVLMTRSRICVVDSDRKKGSSSSIWCSGREWRNMAMSVLRFGLGVGPGHEVGCGRRRGVVERSLDDLNVDRDALALLVMAGYQAHGGPGISPLVR